MKNPVNAVIAIGLAAGGLLGMAGTAVADASLRALLWSIDAVGIVIATSLLALRYFRRGDDFVAGGFLIFAIGESVLLSGTAASLEQSVPAFAAGMALWAAGLSLTGIPRTFALWIRIVSTIGAVLCAVTAARIFGGEHILPTTSPLPYFAYPFVVATFGGWIWTTLRAE
jgi:hypothetical protein